MGKVLKYGLYTSRGVQQCDTAEYKQRCMHNPPNPPDRCEGSQGYEKIDADWMVAAGADFIKEVQAGKETATRCEAGSGRRRIVQSVEHRIESISNRFAQPHRSMQKHTQQCCSIIYFVT